MAISAAVPIIFALQAAFVAPPAPAAPAMPGTEAFTRDRARYESELKAACMSDAGVQIVLEAWTRNRAESAATAGEWRAIERQKAEAAFARPVDMEKMAAALRADAEREARRASRSAETGIAVLRRLSPEDRAIHARRFTIMQPAGPVKRCAG